MWISYEIIGDKKYQQNLKHFYEGKKKMFYFFPILYIWPLLSRGHQRAWIKWCATLIWPLENETRTYSIAKANKIFFKVKMFRLSVIPFVIKLYSRVNTFTKYCILVCQNFPPSKVSGSNEMIRALLITRIWRVRNAIRQKNVSHENCANKEK